LADYNAIFLDKQELEVMGSFTNNSTRAGL